MLVVIGNGNAIVVDVIVILTVDSFVGERMVMIWMTSALVGLFFAIGFVFCGSFASS